MIYIKIITKTDFKKEKNFIEENKTQEFHDAIEMELCRKCKPTQKKNHFDVNFNNFKEKFINYEMCTRGFI